MAGDVAKWLYRLSANYEWTSPFALDADYAFADSAGRVRLVLERIKRLERQITAG